jgi:undecaprenyl diphosphate synthase
LFKRPSSPSTSESEFNELEQKAVELGISLDRLPKHVCVIMDGNGRWAKKRGLPRLIGHREGYKNLRKILLAAVDLKLEYITIYAFSTENWRRSVEETRGLLKLIEKSLRDELRMMHKHNVKVRLSGRIDEIPDTLLNAFKFGTDITQNNTGTTLTVAINYGGRAEIVDAVKQIIQEGIPADQITEETISQHLYNPDIPDPDLMIRTSGELRISNFLTWETVYSEIYITPDFWPEFSINTFLEAIHSFQNRGRRFGHSENVS